MTVKNNNNQLWFGFYKGTYSFIFYEKKYMNNKTTKNASGFY